MIFQHIVCRKLECFQRHINKIGNSVENRQSRLAWHIINEADRKKLERKTKIISGNFHYFHGNTPKIRQTNQKITKGLQDVQIEEELDALQKKWIDKIRKAASLDEIFPEVWKTRIYEDILLRLYNVVCKHRQEKNERKVKSSFFEGKGASSSLRITKAIFYYCVYYALFQNRILWDVEKILGNNNNVFRRNQSATSQNLNYLLNYWKCLCKNSRGSTIVRRFLQDRENLNQIQRI